MAKAITDALAHREQQIQAGNWDTTDEFFWADHVSKPLLFRYSESGGGNASGKYSGCRFWSVRAVEHWAAHRTYTGLRHEHVFPRKRLMDHLRRRFRSTPNLLWVQRQLEQLCVACVVTVAEDQNIPNEHPFTGNPAVMTPSDLWSRYQGSGVALVDHQGLTRSERTALRHVGCLTTDPLFIGLPEGTPVGKVKHLPII